MSLPSDDEINQKTIKYSEYDLITKYNNAFEHGAKWMRSLAEIEIAKLQEQADEYRLKYQALSSRLKHDLSVGKLVETASTGVINNIQYMEYYEYQDYIKKQELEKDKIS